MLLILVGISIVTLMGQNGLLDKTESAVEETNYANAKEKVQLAVIASIDEYSNLNKEMLKENLNKIVGINPLVDEVSFNLLVNVDGYPFIITKLGEVRSERDGDSLKPTIRHEIIQEEGTTAMSVSVRVIAEYGNIGIESIKKPDGTTEKVSVVTYTVPENGNYEFIIKDNDGIETPYVVAVNLEPKITHETTQETIQQGQTATSSVNIRVVAKWGNTRIDSIQKPDGTIEKASVVTYTVTENGNYNFIVKYSDGSETPYVVTVNSIVKTRYLYNRGVNYVGGFSPTLESTGDRFDGSGAYLEMETNEGRVTIESINPVDTTGMKNTCLVVEMVYFGSGHYGGYSPDSYLYVGDKLMMYPFGAWQSGTTKTVSIAKSPYDNPIGKLKLVMATSYRGGCAKVRIHEIYLTDR